MSRSRSLGIDYVSDAYADSLAIMHADEYWQAVEGMLSEDMCRVRLASQHMATVGEDLQTWKLKLSTTKTLFAAFHLNNKEAKRERKSTSLTKSYHCCKSVRLSTVMADTREGQIRVGADVPSVREEAGYSMWSCSNLRLLDTASGDSKKWPGWAMAPQFYS